MRNSIAFICCFFLLLSTAQAVITVTGDVDPKDPSMWASGTYEGGNCLIGLGYGSFGSVTVSGVDSTWIGGFCVGFQGSGELNILDGGTVISTNGGNHIGSYAGSTGSVTVSGIGSTWIAHSLSVGGQGSGELNISDGGTVQVESSISVGCGEDGETTSGKINFNNGTLTTRSLLANSNQLTGMGTINANGLGLDGIDLVFDALHGTQQTLRLNAAGQNITVNLNQTSSGCLGAGYADSGSMVIREGVLIESDGGFIGYNTGATGTVTVDGAGSTWVTGRRFQVGTWGNGQLNITDGGAVHSQSGYLGWYSGSSGVATVSGTNLAWHLGDDLSIGEGGTSQLNINDGGTVNNQYGRIGAYGTVTVDGVGSIWNNTKLTINSSENVGLNIINGGTVNVKNGTVFSSGTNSATIFFDNGTLNTRYLFASSKQLTGTGTINTSNFLFDDIDVNFDDSTATQQTFTLTGPDQNITVHLDGSKWVTFGAGCRGTGSIGISEGAVVECDVAYFGRHSGSFGTLDVTGSGSMLKISGRCGVTIGDDGNGEMNINDGGVVDTYYVCIGNTLGSTSMVTVSGTNSLCNSRDISVGYGGSGVLNIVDGGTAIASNWKLGALPDATGTVTVSGIGSTLTGDELYLGGYGKGELNIVDGGMVNIYNTILVGQDPISSGAIHFDNGTLITKDLVAGAEQLTGNGMIHTRSLIADGFDLVFDALHGPQQILTLTGPDKNIVIRLDKDDSGHLGAGYTGTGSMTIRDGIAIRSGYGYVGYHAGSNGTVTVTGPNSTWKNWDLDIGYCGNGVLNITDGGVVDNGICYIAYQPGSTGKVTVSGAGSSLTSSQRLYVGSDRRQGPGGNGQLNITDGGTVTAFNCHIGSPSNATSITTVSGTGSVLTCNGELYVDDSGELKITDGGLVQVEGVTLVSQNSPASIYFQNGTLTTNSLMVDNSQLKGTGVINTNGFIADEMDLVFDASYGLQQTFTLSNHPGQNITVNLDQNSTGDLVAGYAGRGSLTIQDGIVVEANSLCLGYHSSSTGTATVSGDGSALKIQNDLYVGRDGTGELNVTEGGLVCVTGDLNVDDDSFINISNGGMFALLEKEVVLLTPDYSSLSIDSEILFRPTGLQLDGYQIHYPNLDDFFDVIRWWDDSINDWALLTTATEGTDYTFEYPTEGELAGYAVLTVGSLLANNEMLTVPEPSTVALLLTALVAVGLVPTLRKRNGKQY